MNIKSYLICSIYTLFFMLASSDVLAAENIIGWSLTPSDGFPAFTQAGNSYRVSYTIYNNHPAVSMPLSTNISQNGQFDIVDECNGLTLAPQGQANSTCNISITLTPTQEQDQSIQVELAYGKNRVRLPMLSSSPLIGNGAQGKLIAYMPGYLPPATAQAIFNAGYTHILVAFGVFSTSSPGTITSAFDMVSKTLIQQMQRLGIKVLLSLGGASSDVPNTTVNFHDALTLAASATVFQDKFIASLESLIAEFGFDGFDFDIEFGLNKGSGGTISNPGGDIAVLANIINQMHTKHPSVLLTLAPQTVNISANSAFNEPFVTYSSLIMQTYASLTWVGVQVYNSGTIFGIDGNIYAPSNPNTPNASVALGVDLLASWPQGAPQFFQPYVSNLDPSQVVLGYLAPNASGAVDGGPPPIPTAIIKRAIQCLRTGVAGANSCDTYVPPQAYPGIGGVFAWQTVTDQSNNFNFATSLKNCVLYNNCS